MAASPVAALFILFWVSGASALVCYRCAYFESSSLGFVGKIVTSAILEPKCGKDELSGVSTETCTSSSQSCGFVKAQASVSLLGVDQSTAVYIRGCMDTGGKVSWSQCEEASAKDYDEVQRMMKVMTLGLGDVDIDGKVCACGDDRCVAGDCYNLFGYCLFSMEFWAISAGLVAGAVFFLVLCCCCCCRKKRPYGIVVNAPPANMVHVMPVTGNAVSNYAMTNPAAMQATVMQPVGPQPAVKQYNY